ncbi:hypothetical protein PMAYCL1PPCAC_04037, partial [Pristionchus mayeri]
IDLISMSSGKIQCLLCKEKISVKDLHKHIHKHIKYFPMKCVNCDFESACQNEVTVHLYETDDHQVTDFTDAYKQWVVQTIIDDTIFAGKHGEEELMKQKNNKKNLSSPRTAPTQSSIGRPPRQASPIRKTQPTKKTPSPRKASTTRQASTTRRTPPSDDSSDEERAPPQSSRQKAAVKTDNKQRSVQQQRENVADENPEEKDDKLIADLTRRLNGFTKCAKCNEMVKYNLVDRQTHVKQKHMTDVPLHYIQQHPKLVEDRTADAFPGLVSSCVECELCPKTIQSRGGRITHVVNYHFRNKIRCHICPNFSSALPSEIYGHFKNKHGINYKKDLDSSQLNVEVCDHRTKLEKLASLLFPMDFPSDTSDTPSRRTSVTPKRKKNHDDDDDGDEEFDPDEFRTGVQMRTRSEPKRSRRVSPPTDDDDEEEDSDDEKKEDAESGRESQMEADDEDKNGSTVGSSLSTAAITGSPSNRGPNREVKVDKDVKEEPVTPETRVDTGFSRRPLLPTPPSATRSLVCSSEETERNGGYEGWNGKGGGRGGRG